MAAKRIMADCDAVNNQFAYGAGKGLQGMKYEDWSFGYCGKNTISYVLDTATYQYAVTKSYTDYSTNNQAVSSRYKYE
ncbi:hypothetical protein CHS0354_027802 [Potamilus streckersoni]|uniref:Uncharacterized protein n=1 Tax=Potamilus streckersoni TaxID=2493646 RepID=A0AAE0T1A2_9BIVA|nr:hypothetical protein CHS0354_027802 [Potamilus streckersoni]